MVKGHWVNINLVQSLKRGRGQHGGGTHGECKKRHIEPKYRRVGYEGRRTPFYLKFKSQSFYENHHQRLSYKPLPMQRLQHLIDIGFLDPDRPIDVTQLMGTGQYSILPIQKEGGFLLEDDGADLFCSAINLEIQWATEPCIAAVERMGGFITTAYYDPMALMAAINPQEFFKKGVPIPRRMLPPQKLVEYYSSAKNRGYLADPEEVAEERFILAQKYGYDLPDIKSRPNADMLYQRKDPRQIFYGLQPGWIVNLTDKVILKPTDPKLKKYYST